jgi:hypothetical protein
VTTGTTTCTRLRRRSRATAAQLAPWYVVPADHKWFTRLIVAGAIGEAVDKLGLSYPRIDDMKKKELVTASEKLDREKVTVSQRDNRRRCRTSRR